MANTREQAQEDLGQYAEKWETCVRAALAEYVKNYAAVRHKHSKRTEASIVHDLMVDHFKATFGTDDDSSGDIAVYKKGNLTLVVVGQGKYKVKLKKLDKNLLTRNISTNAVLRFVWQQESFKQVPPPTNLHVGYQPISEASLTSSKVWVICPDGKRVGWEWELAAAVAKQDAERKGADIIPIQQGVEAKKKRAKLKDSLKKQDEKQSKAEGDDGGDGSSS